MLASKTHPSLIKGAGTSAETPPPATSRASSLARKSYRHHIPQRHPSSTTSPPSTGLVFSPSPLRERKGGQSRLAKGAQRGFKTRCPRTVQIDVAVVRLLFGPSLSPLGYGVGSPRSRRLLWLLQTLSWSAQSIFSSFGRMSCCRTYERVGEFSLLLDRAGETVCHYM